MQFQFYLPKCCSLTLSPFLQIILRNLSAVLLPTIKSIGGQKSWGFLEARLLEGFRLRRSVGLRHACALGETHLAMVLELHPASVTESLWGRGNTVRLKGQSREDCNKGASLGQSIPSSILSSNTFPFFPTFMITYSTFIFKSMFFLKCICSGRKFSIIEMLVLPFLLMQVVIFK